MSLSTKVLFFCFSSLLLLPCQKTLVFRFFSINSQVILKNSRPLASNFSILLSNLLKKISIQEFYDTETTTARRKQKNKTLVDRKQLFQFQFTVTNMMTKSKQFLITPAGVNVENTVAISCPPKSYFFVFPQLLLFPCRKTLVLRFFQ